MVARDTVMPWWWSRCQAMVSGPASRPVAVSFSRSSTIRSTASAGIAVGDGLGSPGAGLEGGLALGLVAGQQLEEPGLGDAVLGGDFADGSVLDHHGGDQQSVECHARTLEAGQPLSPG